MFCIEDEWLRIGKQQGMQQGMQQGEDKLSRLNMILLSEQRYDDLHQASLDKEYRSQLYEQYGIA